MTKHIHVHVHRTRDAGKTGAEYGVRPLGDKFGIWIKFWRNGQLETEDKNTQPWPTREVAMAQAKRAAEGGAQQEDMKVLGPMPGMQDAEPLPAGVEVKGDDVYLNGQKKGRIGSFAGTWFYVPSGTRGGITARSRTDAIQKLVGKVGDRARDAEREPDQSDLNAAARGLNMLGMSPLDLEDLIKETAGKTMFASKATHLAAKQMLAAKRRMGARDGKHIHVHVGRKVRDDLPITKLDVAGIRQALKNSGEYVDGDDILTAHFAGSITGREQVAIYTFTGTGPDGPVSGRIYVEERGGRFLASF